MKFLFFKGTYRSIISLAQGFVFRHLATTTQTLRNFLVEKIISKGTFAQHNSPAYKIYNIFNAIDPTLENCFSLGQLQINSRQESVLFRLFCFVFEKILSEVSLCIIFR